MKFKQAIKAYFATVTDAGKDDTFDRAAEVVLNKLMAQGGFDDVYQTPEEELKIIWGEIRERSRKV